jgi:pseudouridine synthase
VRLQKLLADAGVASRRASESLIQARRVTVNGELVSRLGTRVDPRRDRICVDGHPVRTRRKLYVALNKPRGYVCTRKDPEGRPVVGELLPPEWAHLHSVGRLDYASEGLLLLTNDGDFSLRVAHPRYGVAKRYAATVRGRVEPRQLQELLRGVSHDGERLKARQARLARVGPAQTVVELELTEGRNREVRRLFEAIGLRVERLQRTRIGPVRLGSLQPGRWRTLTAGEIDSLLPP